MRLVRDDRQRNSPPGDLREHRLRRSWWTLVAAFALLAALAAVRMATGEPKPLDVVLGALIALVGIAGLFHRRAIGELEQGRRREAESFARILQGLSRSVSADAIIAAIAQDLGVAAAADHTIIVRLRPDTNVLEATLVSSRPGVPNSITRLPLSDLEDRGAALDDRLDAQAAPAAVGIPIEGERTAFPIVADRPGAGARPRPELEPVGVVARSATGRAESGAVSPWSVPASPALAVLRAMPGGSDDIAPDRGAEEDEEAAGSAIATGGGRASGTAAGLVAAAGAGLVAAAGAGLVAAAGAGLVAAGEAGSTAELGSTAATGAGLHARLEQKLGSNQPPEIETARSVAGPGRTTGASLRVAEQLAARVRTLYGLHNTVVAPLVVGRDVAGALVLSRRTDEAWPASSGRLLAGAAVEASAALARANWHRAAETMASTDALTGLPNRRYFEEFCGLLARRRRADDDVGVLMVDIDNFKRLNDTFGHGVGDQVLRAVATAIAGAVRDGDVPARYGGEEFAVLLRNPAPGVALEVGERVRSAVSGLDLAALGPAAVTVSVGVAVARWRDQPIPALLEEADRALYQAKRSGRDKVVAA